MDSHYKTLLDSYPFLSYITYGGLDYIGVIQNCDDIITSMYDYSMLRSPDQKMNFLTLAEQWWWESNRQMPINVFLKNDWAPFRVFLKTFNSKDVVIHYGPQVNLKEIAQKRSKRRVITLVRKV